MRKKLNQKEKKVKLTCTINPIVYEKLIKSYGNVSKHVEWLIYQDLKKNNKINEIPL